MADVGIVCPKKPQIQRKGGGTGGNEFPGDCLSPSPADLRYPVQSACDGQFSLYLEGTRRPDLKIKAAGLEKKDSANRSPGVGCGRTQGTGKVTGKILLIDPLRKRKGRREVHAQYDGIARRIPLGDGVRARFLQLRERGLFRKENSRGKN